MLHLLRTGGDGGAKPGRARPPVDTDAYLRAGVRFDPMEAWSVVKARLFAM